MAQHTHQVERDTGTGMATGMIVGILVVVLVAILALFFVFGGPARFSGSPSTAPAPSGQTNVNVPSQGQPQSGPNINVPRQIDVNVNQPAQQAPAAPQAPTGGQAPAPSNP